MADGAGLPGLRRRSPGAAAQVVQIPLLSGAGLPAGWRRSGKRVRTCAAIPHRSPEMRRRSPSHNRTCAIHHRNLHHSSHRPAPKRMGSGHWEPEKLHQRRWGLHRTAGGQHHRGSPTAAEVPRKSAASQIVTASRGGGGRRCGDGRSRRRGRWWRCGG